MVNVFFSSPAPFSASVCGSDCFTGQSPCTRLARRAQKVQGPGMLRKGGKATGGRRVRRGFRQELAPVDGIGVDVPIQKTRWPNSGTQQPAKHNIHLSILHKSCLYTFLWDWFCGQHRNKQQEWPWLEKISETVLRCNIPVYRIRSGCKKNAFDRGDAPNPTCDCHHSPCIACIPTIYVIALEQTKCHPPHSTYHVLHSAFVYSQSYTTSSRASRGRKFQGDKISNKKNILAVKCARGD